MGRLLLAAVMAPFLAISPASAAPDGAVIYKRCAACHLATGAGVPGAFPPLDGHVGAMAETAGGRDYLAMVVTAGLTGEIKVNDRSYRGFMTPLSGLKDDELAAVLNHVLTGIIKPASTAQAFTAEEVAAIRERHKGIRAAEVLKLRPQIVPAQIVPEKGENKKGGDKKSK